MTDGTKRLVGYGITLALGVGLLIYGVEADVHSVREMAASIIGVATGAVFLKRPKEQ